jgi:hypothetical protein
VADQSTDDDFTDNARPWSMPSELPSVVSDASLANVTTRTRATARGVPRLTASDSVVVLAIGDVHGLYEPVFEALREVPEATAILQVGDLTAGKPGRETHVDGDPYVIDQLSIPFIWVHGNHEHWELFGTARGAAGTGSLQGANPASRLPGTHLWAGTTTLLPGSNINVVGLPGNYARSWYGESKPFPGDRCRHFNRDDVEAMSRHPYPNVLLMHEAFRGQAPGRVGAMGIPVLARLVAELQPAVVLTGHHHLFAAHRHGPTLAISLPPAWEGYTRLVFHRSGALAGWEFCAFGALIRTSNGGAGYPRRHYVDGMPSATLGIPARGKVT